MELSIDFSLGQLGTGSSHSIGLGSSAKIHYNDVILRAMASQIARLKIVYLTIYSGADQRKHQSSASQAFVMGMQKMFPFCDVIMSLIVPVHS